MHPAAIIFTYAGFLFSSGLFGALMGGGRNALIAAVAFSVPMVVCGVMALRVNDRPRLGTAGVALAILCAVITSVVYAWRAALAVFEQSHAPKGMTISLMSAAGIVTAVLLLRHLVTSTADVDFGAGDSRTPNE